MTIPATISVSFDFSSGATFGYPFTIGDSVYGILGTGILGSSAVPEPVVDLTPNVYSINIKRGRNIMRDQYESGTATVKVLDPLSYFNPQNVSSPYYGYLTPLRKLRISAVANSGSGSSYNLFSGYTTEYRYTYPKNEETGYVEIICSDAFRLMQQATVTTVADATAGQTTGARIGKILDQVSWPTSMRSLDSGNTTCVVDPGTSRTSLDALLNAAFSEQGAFYIDAAGTAVFLNRTNVIKKANITPTEFNQTLGIPYTNIVFSFDDKLIINSSGMTRVGGTEQVAENATSIAKYFSHQLNESNLVAQTDADTLNIARIYVATRAETTIRIDAITIDLLDTQNVPTETMLDFDYFRTMRIKNVQPDGSTIEKVLQAQGFEWNITPNSMKVTITTLEPIVEGFIIGSSLSGIIGTNILAYQEI